MRSIVTELAPVVYRSSISGGQFYNTTVAVETSGAKFEVGMLTEERPGGKVCGQGCPAIPELPRRHKSHVQQHTPRPPLHAKRSRGSVPMTPVTDSIAQNPAMEW